MTFHQNARARAVDLRTYCRPLDDEGTKFETREQMLHRSMYTHHKMLLERLGKKNHKAELQELERLGTDGKAAVAGRTQWLGGTKYAFDRACCQFNCSFTELRTVYDLVDGAWLLLNGCGVGFKPKPGTLHGYARPIPTLQVIGSSRAPHDRGQEGNSESLPSDDNDQTWTIKVGDSAAAWAKAGAKLFTGRTAKRLVLDFSEIRGPGGRLKGYGWICNGAKPLEDAFRSIHEILNASAGSLLDELQIMDVMNWWGTVLSSRRAAEICVMDSYNPRIEEFKSAKKEYWRDNPQRRQSNNTILYWSKPLPSALEDVLRFADECGGDPAICNAEAALHKAPWFTGFNPCFAPGTLIVTRHGAFPVETLVGKSVEVYDGGRWVTVNNFRVTGENQEVLDVELQDGSVVTVTPYHTMVLSNGDKVEARDLSPGDRLMPHDVTWDGDLHEDAAYAKGFLVGDGTVTSDRPLLWVYTPKRCCIRRLIDSIEELPAVVRTNGVGAVMALEEDEFGRHRISGLAARKEGLLEWVTAAKTALPQRVFSWDRSTKVEFLAGLFDADGTALDSSHGFSYQLTSVSKDLLLGVQTLLKSLGIHSRVSLSRSGRECDLPGGSYWCNPCYRLSIGQAGSIRLSHLVPFERLTSFATRSTAYTVKPRFDKVVSVASAGVRAKVYCCTVPDTHTVALATGVVTGQCAEILLPDKGFCNLVTLCLPRYRKRFAELERAAYVMGRANYRQTCVDLNDGILQPTWHQTNESLRLCGVSVTGVTQSDWLTDYQIRRLRNAAVMGAYSMADELRLPRPKAVTTGKPEGTVSKTLGGLDVGDVAEGIHRPLGRYIFNWVNFSVHDPLVPLLESSGYKTLPNPSDAANVLVCFPAEYANVRFDRVEGKEVNLEPAVNQLNRYLRWNTLWADHNMSCTVSYSPWEIPDVVRWLDANWDRGFIAVSFLRRNDPTKTAKDLGHPYLPQEVVTEETFRAYTSTLREVAWGRVHGVYDVSEDACASGACPVR